MIRWICTGLIFALVIVFCIFTNKMNYNEQKNDCVVFILNQNEWLSALMTTSVSLLYIPIYLFAKNWKIEFDEHSFSFTNMWKIKKYYEYADVTFIDTGRALRIYQNNKKIVAISALIENVDKLEKQYNLFKKRNGV